MTAASVAGDFDLAEQAPAKVNLALHVTGRRADGYHLLDMLVTFTRHGDRLGFQATDADQFHLSGRFAPQLADASGNLVLKARDALRRAAHAAGLHAPPVSIHLEKNLPVASGIGGGSADAAATLRGLMRLWQLELPTGRLGELALELGADVPMCLAGRPLMATGIGEILRPLSGFPSFAMLLGNPLVGVSTPEVFRRLAGKDNPPIVLPAEPLRDRAQWLSAIGSLRNDLELPARALCPEIGLLSRLIDEQGAGLTRMSGSGASCFGFFHDIHEASAAAIALHKIRPDWYFQATETIEGEP
jgi:4-diphosphocytidyl-2-C-methyl-D-erythritol kinase